MKQLLILSGKGGTGKTTISSAFIKLSQASAYADCDVDAPNLHLVTAKQLEEPVRSDYYGMPQAQIHEDFCINCGICEPNCHFDAIFYDDGYKVNPFACEGCGFCLALCPTSAISLNPSISGEQLLYKKAQQVFATAQLKMGRGNTGKLVTEVKNQMRTHAPESTDLAIIDGSPGLGCSVIASLSGVDMVLIVAEPSRSGISDMDRIIEMAKMFDVEIVVCVNKSDVNQQLTDEIKTFCEYENLSFVGEIPFDIEAVKAVNNGLTIVDVDCQAGLATQKIFDRVKNILI